MVVDVVDLHAAGCEEGLDHLRGDPPMVHPRVVRRPPAHERLVLLQEGGGRRAVALVWNDRAAGPQDPPELPSRRRLVEPVEGPRRGRPRCSRARARPGRGAAHRPPPVSYTHLRAHETDSYLVCRLLLEKKNTI